jgi:ABC-type transport system involved in cytochrome c biogenesis ATPase subunit
MAPATTPPIGLESLSIRDFRGIDCLDLDFTRPDGRRNSLVVLAGPNGCGKTSVLEAALIAVGGYKLAVGPLGRRAVRKGAEDFEIRARLRDWISEDETIEIVHSSRSDPPRPDPRLPHWYFSSWRAPSLVGSVNVTVGKPGRRPAKNDPNRLRNVKQQLTNAAAAQSFPGSGKLLLRKYSEWIDRINEAWATFYPGRDYKFFVDLVDSDEGGVGAFDVFYNSGETPPLPVDDLSAGQLELFLFLAALILNDDRQGIVFIDEPELHLDPQWHAPILRALMRLQPNAQFIVATHSPTIYETAKSYERHFLVPQDDPRAAIWRGAVARP